MNVIINNSCGDVHYWSDQVNESIFIRPYANLKTLIMKKDIPRLSVLNRVPIRTNAMARRRYETGVCRRTLDVLRASTTI